MFHISLMRDERKYIRGHLSVINNKAFFSFYNGRIGNDTEQCKYFKPGVDVF